MSDSADDIRKRMEQVRLEVGDDVMGIVESAKALTDWRLQVRKHPYLCFGAVAALGFLLVPRRKRPDKSVLDSVEAQELIALLKKHNLNATPPSQAASKGMIATLAGMAAPFVMRAAMDYGQQLVANFGQTRAPKTDESDDVLARPEEIREEFNRPR